MRDGFLGQKMVTVPLSIRESVNAGGTGELLHLTDIGYYPNAANHFRRRREGADEYILIYCVEGAGWIRLNRITHQLTPNSYFIIPARTAHQYGSDLQDYWSIYWVHFNGSSAQSLFEKYCRQPSAAADSSMPSVIKLPFEKERVACFDRLIFLLEQGHGAAAIEYANIYLWHLLGSFIYQEHYSRIEHQDSQASIVDSAIQYMQNNIYQVIRIEELAEHLNHSPSYIYSLFKKSTGYSPISYFNYLKVQEACKYLSFTDLDVKEISFSLGFQDPLYFSRVFKKRMSVSPTEYRLKLGRQPKPA